MPSSARDTSGPASTPPVLGLLARRGPLVMAGEDLGPSRLWILLFFTRHAVIVGLAALVAMASEFGDDRLLIAVILLAVVLPYDVGVHWYTRRHRHLPVSMPFVFAPLPACFVIAFPETWVLALLAALGNLTLFSLTFDVRIAAGSYTLSAVAFGVAAAVADPVMPIAGAVGFTVISPAVVLGVGALLDTVQLSEQRYRDYVENANDMIYVHDLDGVFLSANETALRVTGYTRQEFGKVNAAEIVAPKDLEEVWDRIQRAVRSVASDADTTPWELDILTKGGEHIPVEVNTRVIRHRGRAVAIHGIARDITERRQVEAARDALDRARSEFIANAAHELRTPLTTLAGLAAVLAQGGPATTEEDLTGGLEALARQGRRVQSLADRLLDLSTIELGGIHIAEEPVVVAEVVGQALEGTPRPDGISVDVAVSPDIRAVSDPVRLGEILTNLLANAYRYGGSTVRVSASTNGDVILAVEDDGPGVPADLVPRLYEPFTTGDAHGGTGLGLAICARLAQALGGDLHYEARDPHGARFVVRLPSGAPTPSVDQA